MKAFVTGATGFVGREIVRQLREAGHSVRILARRPYSPQVRQVIECWGAEVHPGDVLEAASLRGAPAGMEAVVHLVGIIAEVGRSTFEHVHTDGTRNLIAAAQQAGVQRFVHMSALGTRPDAASRYHQSKWAAEELVQGSGLEFTIFRPSLIYGSGDQFINLFAKIARWSPVVPLVGSPRARFQPVAVEAVAAALVRSLKEPRSVGQTYDLCGPELLTLAEIVDQMLAALRWKRWKLQVPFSLARYQAAGTEFYFRKLLRKAPPLSRDQLVMLQEDNAGDARTANELFGLEQVPLRLGIARYLDAKAKPRAACKEVREVP